MGGFGNFHILVGGFSHLPLNLSKNSEIDSAFIARCRSVSIGFSRRLENSRRGLIRHNHQFSPTVGAVLVESNVGLCAVARISFAAALIPLYRQGTPIPHKRVKYQQRALSWCISSFRFVAMRSDFEVRVPFQRR